MRNITNVLQSHLASEIITLSSCFKITRVDGQILALTDHDQNLVIDDLEYDSIAAFTASTIASGSNMAADNLDLSGSFSSKITKSDLLAGKYDFAKIEIFSVNWQDPNSGKLVQKNGIIGEISLNKNQFYAEVRGLTQFLSQNPSQSYMPHCLANLGDNRCSFDLKADGFTVYSSVNKVQNQQIFIGNNLTAPNNWFAGGVVLWTSGKNSGLFAEIKEYGKQQITLAIPMIYQIKEQDEFKLTAGCDKTSSTCIEKFNNIINFRGEPDLPGIDNLMGAKIK